MSLEKAVTTASLRRVLRYGTSEGKSAKTLAFELDTTERAIRKLVDELIEEGVPVCAHPGTGYFIARTQEEVDTCADFLRERAMHGLKKQKQLRNAYFNWELAHPELVANPTPNYQPPGATA